MVRKIVPFAALSLALAACATSDPAPVNEDASGDVAVDSGDIGVDSAPDASPDAQPDAEPDATPDVEPDTTPDATPDTAPDTTPDVEPDVPTGPCGDGVIAGTEVCDNSAPINGCGIGERCNDTCTECATAPPLCGDRAVNGTEICDSSAPADGCGAGQECNDVCTACVGTSVPECGDGAVNGDEPCDPSAADDGCDAGTECSAVCTGCVAVEAPRCGDGDINGREVCDATALPSTGCAAPLICSAACDACEERAPEARCGDGSVNGREVCDGSSRLASGCFAPSVCNDDCTACAIPPRCGDAAVNGAEVCDPTAPTTGCGDGTVCADDCLSCDEIADSCGDGIVNGDDTCDGPTAPDNGCGPGETCTADCGRCVVTGCGDGALAEGETCDPTAPTTGCDDGALCALDCSACTLCGDYELSEGEECDFDGVFGDLGTCDIATEACSSCRCAPLRLEIVSATGSATAIVGTFAASVTVHDEVGFETFALLFIDAEGNIVDYFQGARDLLLDSRFVPEDNPIDYEWRFQVHMLQLPDAEVVDSVYLVLYGADGTASNPVAWDGAVLFGAPDTGAACDPASYLPVCIPEHLCDETSGVCTDTGDTFGIEAALASLDGVDDVLFEFIVRDDTGDFLPYWQLYAFDSEGGYVAFRSWDDVAEDLGDGTWYVSYLAEDFSTNFGVPLASIESFIGVVFDFGDVEVSEELTLE